MPPSSPSEAAAVRSSRASGIGGPPATGPSRRRVGFWARCWNGRSPTVVAFSCSWRGPAGSRTYRPSLARCRSMRSPRAGFRCPAAFRVRRWPFASWAPHARHGSPRRVAEGGARRDASEARPGNGDLKRREPIGDGTAGTSGERRSGIATDRRWKWCVPSRPQAVRRRRVPATDSATVASIEAPGSGTAEIPLKAIASLGLSAIANRPSWIEPGV